MTRRLNTRVVTIVTQFGRIGKSSPDSGSQGAFYPIKTWTAPSRHGCLKGGDTPSWLFVTRRQQSRCSYIAGLGRPVSQVRKRLISRRSIDRKRSTRVSQPLATGLPTGLRSPHVVVPGKIAWNHELFEEAQCIAAPSLQRLVYSVIYKSARSYTAIYPLLNDSFACRLVR